MPFFTGTAGVFTFPAFPAVTAGIDGFAASSRTMKILFLIIKILLFLAALTFAVKNTDGVTVRYYLGLQWQAPLIFVILVVFCVGAVAGVFASLAHIVRLRRDLFRLRKELKSLKSEDRPAETTQAPPVPSVSRVVDAV